MNNIVYKYRCGQPKDYDEVMNEIRNSHRYKNKLVEIELKRREEWHEAQERFCSTLMNLKLQIDVLSNQKKTLSALKLSGNVAQMCKNQIVRIQNRLRILRKNLKEEKTRVANDSEFAIIKKQLKERDKERKQLAYTESELFWGTKSFIFQSNPNSGKGVPPKFKKYKGEGCLSSSFQNFKGCTSLNEEGKPFYIKDGIGYFQYQSENKKPVYTTFRVHLHRELPENIEITKVVLQCKQRAGKKYWHILVSVRREESFLDTCGEGTVAVDFGWRKTPSGLKVATFVDDSGNSFSTFLPNELLGKFKYVNDIKSIRDNKFNEAIDLIKTLDGPEWYKEAIRYCKQWRSQDKLVKLIDEWKENRFEGDENVFEALTRLGTKAQKWKDAGWLHRDRHLWQIEANVRHKAGVWRDKIYEHVAYNLRKNYAHVVTESVAWSDLIQKKEHKQNVIIASPYKFTQLIKNKFGQIGSVSAAYNSRTCSECGEVWESNSSEEISCGNCLTVWDRDVNACQNMLELVSM